VKKAEHQVVHYPESRIATIDLGRIALGKHHLAGLLEVDVTDVLVRLKEHSAAGQSVSFFAWIVKTIAAVVAENRYVHGVAGPGNSTIVFDDVDVSVIVERKVRGTRVPLPLLIKKAHEKSVEEIYSEIRQARKQAIADQSNYVLSDNRGSRFAMRLYYVLPRWLRLFTLGRILNNPHRRKTMMGTVVVTSVGTVGGLPGWVIPKSMHNLCFALGSIVKKPWVVDNEIRVRDILHLTVLVDHDVVDGIPAVRFAAKLVDRIEKGMEELAEPSNV
jgi:pyruvate/2-oxoglutarate dehydrogenase complex dihydrolipoamide acyltransferase (E2) component